MRGIVRSVLLLFSVAVLSGCGGGGEDYGTPVTVTGNLKMDGQPLADAQVTFTAMEGLPGELRSRMATTDAQGNYKLDEVYPAEYRVMVQKFAYDPAQAPADGGVAQKDPLALYGAESSLRAQVSDEKTEFPFELTGS